MIYRTLHRKLKIEEHEPTKTEVEGQKIFYIINFLWVSVFDPTLVVWGLWLGVNDFHNLAVIHAIIIKWHSVLKISAHYWSELIKVCITMKLNESPSFIRPSVKFPTIVVTSFMNEISPVRTKYFKCPVLLNYYLTWNSMWWGYC
jgi:hypothetical protein